MLESVRCALGTQRALVRARWEALLRKSHVSSALADPDVLVFMMDRTLDELMKNLQQPPERPQEEETDSIVCECGMNPLLGYFKAAEAALVETLESICRNLPALSDMEQRESFTDLRCELERMRCKEVTTFCGVCQIRDRNLTNQTDAHSAPCMRSR